MMLRADRGAPVHWPETAFEEIGRGDGFGGYDHGPEGDFAGVCAESRPVSEWRVIRPERRRIVPYFRSPTTGNHTALASAAERITVWVAFV
jgi:hypothetical protein